MQPSTTSEVSLVTNLSGLSNTPDLEHLSFSIIRVYTEICFQSEYPPNKFSDFVSNSLTPITILRDYYNSLFSSSDIKDSLNNILEATEYLCFPASIFYYDNEGQNKDQIIEENIWQNELPDCRDILICLNQTAKLEEIINWLMFLRKNLMLLSQRRFDEIRYVLLIEAILSYFMSTGEHSYIEPSVNGIIVALGKTTESYKYLKYLTRDLHDLLSCIRRENYKRSLHSSEYQKISIFIPSVNFRTYIYAYLGMGYLELLWKCYDTLGQNGISRSIISSQILVDGKLMLGMLNRSFQLEDREVTEILFKDQPLEYSLDSLKALKDACLLINVFSYRIPIIEQQLSLLSNSIDTVPKPFLLPCVNK